MNNYITEPERKIEVKKKYRTVVVGGGIAGISAALAAARNGSKVLLIESQYILGGLATAGLVTIYLPLCDGMGHQVSFGIAEELFRLSIANGCEDRYPETWLESDDIEKRQKQRFEVRYNPYYFAIKAEKLLTELGVDILFGTTVCDVVKENDKITHLITESSSGRQAIEVSNVIDTTGDADICYLAGENTVMFKQGNVPASWYYYVKNGKNHLNTLGFSDIPDSQKTAEQLEDAKTSIRFKGIEAEELSELTLYSHQKLLDEFLLDGEISSEHSLSTIATIPQIRMTRRIGGVYTQDDTEKHKEYSDSVGMFSDWRKAGPVYELPFRALYGKNISNLITAGRCISVTDAMWDITRVIPVCAVSGEAAGTAAALTDDFSKTDISLLQQRLKENGVKLHGKEL